MKRNERNRQSNRKYTALRLIALFFRAVCACRCCRFARMLRNETFDIPSYAQQISAEGRKAEAVDNTQTAFKNSDSSKQEQTPDLPDSEEDCFCYCSYILLGFSPNKSIRRFYSVR